MNKSKYFYINIAIGILVGLIPSVVLYFSHGSYPSIPIEIMDDTLYYLGRIDEILTGNYFIGNSYILEHVKNVTTAFFVGDWLYAIPFIIFSFFNIPLNFIIIFSEVFWVVITAIFLYVLYKQISIPEKVIPWFTTLSLFSILFFAIRPVTMSVVYPIFLFFLITLYNWLTDPLNNKNKSLLVVSSVLSFYVYTYLWQIVLVSFGLMFLVFLYKKEFVKDLSIVITSTIFLSIPVFLYTWKQVSNEFYFETLERVGLVNTHTIGTSAMIYTALLLIVVFTLYFINKKLYTIDRKKELFFFTIISAALLITGLSNVFSGKDLELAVHIGRFNDIFLSIFFGYIIHLYFINKKYPVGRLLLVPAILIFIYLSTLVYGSYKIISSIPSLKNNNYYLPALHALDSYSKTPSVVFSNDRLGSYIPVITEHYVLFHPNAELYITSNFEIEERYLVSRMFEVLTEDELRADFRKYAGVGNAVHKANVYNRNVKFCFFIKKFIDSTECNSSVDYASFQEKDYFDNLLYRYDYIVKNKKTFLGIYNVDLILVDTYTESWAIDDDLFYEKVKIDNRFTLFKVNKL